MTTQDAATARQIKWLDSRPESAVKTKAEEIAKVWGDQVLAKRLFSEFVVEKRLVRWEQIALCDMITAFRAKLGQF